VPRKPPLRQTLAIRREKMSCNYEAVKENVLRKNKMNEKRFTVSQSRACEEEKSTL